LAVRKLQSSHPPNMNDFTTTARVWLITGCSSGFGMSLATAVLARGGRVVATARNAGALSELVAQFPDDCLALALDVTDAAQVKSVIAKAVEAFGRIDVVVNNAGFGLVGAFEELGDEQITRNFETNFFGAMSVIRASLPLLRAQGSGHIVNISAAAVISNYAGFSIYGATKWALEGVSESLAAELKPLGIKVTIVQPGPFRTDFIARSLERADNHIADYDRTSGKFARLLETMAGKQPGDPAKAAQAIITAVESDTPPLRLVLGKYANEKLRRKLAEAERERAAWESVGLPTEF
jgi:NAD(P)-dependent dehydrogenase (short-subunit alcohol dehydrogenase family)